MVGGDRDDILKGQGAHPRRRSVPTPRDTTTTLLTTVFPQKGSRDITSWKGSRVTTTRALWSVTSSRANNIT